MALGGGVEEDEFEPPRSWKLTRSEALVLRVLCQRKLTTREQIAQSFDEVRHGWEAESRVIDVYICKLRRKLGACGFHIETVWGQGFELVERDAVKAACRPPQMGSPS